MYRNHIITILAGVAELFPCPEPTLEQLQTWKLAKGIKDSDLPAVLPQVGHFLPFSTGTFMMRSPSRMDSFPCRVWGAGSFLHVFDYWS